jgi:hypothetical protein
MLTKKLTQNENTTHIRMRWRSGLRRFYRKRRTQKQATMRTVILVVGQLIAGAINPDLDIGARTASLLQFMFVVCVVMDIIDFFRIKNK